MSKSDPTGLESITVSGNPPEPGNPAAAITNGAPQAFRGLQGLIARAMNGSQSAQNLIKSGAYSQADLMNAASDLGNSLARAYASEGTAAALQVSVGGGGLGGFDPSGVALVGGPEDTVSGVAEDLNSGAQELKQGLNALGKYEVLQMRGSLVEANALLPDNITQAQFGQLAGFIRGGAPAPTPEVVSQAVSRLQAAGVSADAESAFARFYEETAAALKLGVSNPAAAPRAALLKAISQAYP